MQATVVVKELQTPENVLAAAGLERKDVRRAEKTVLEDAANRCATRLR